MNSTGSQIVITNQDHERLSFLIDGIEDGSVGFLEEELGRARIVPQTGISRDVVTMNSVVTFLDEGTNEEHQVALVYPMHAEASMGRISVLAPLGAALLGLKVGQSIEFPIPGGKTRRIHVAAVVFQPESLGALDL